MKKKVMLVVLDGFGVGPDGLGNAIQKADTPILDRLNDEHPAGLLDASGEAVGLTAGSMGGSEVGHFAMGAGRIVPQFQLAIDRSIESGELLENNALKSAFDHSLEHDVPLHLIGMISDKGVHSHIDHLLALIKGAAQVGIKKVYIHAISDGRDVQEQSMTGFLSQISRVLEQTKTGSIATLIGRYYAMDRDHNNDRTKVAYDLLTKGEGDYYESPFDGVNAYYDSAAGVTDYYAPAMVFDRDGKIQDGDAVIFFNYRTDRTRQLTAAFVDPDFDGFERVLQNVYFVCMGPYSDIAPVAFTIPEVKNTLGEWLSEKKIPQFRCAEKEKYAHVTFFFNCQRNDPYLSEDRQMIDSHKVMSFAERPEMSAAEITNALIEAMKNDKYPVMISNYANCDLVGHSGDFDATVKSVEVVDECLGKLLEQARESGVTVMITGDHGNAEDMKYPDGSQKPSHSMNPVPLYIVLPSGERVDVKNGGLSDVAPTLLHLMDLQVPVEMTGKSLV